MSDMKHQFLDKISLCLMVSGTEGLSNSSVKDKLVFAHGPLAFGGVAVSVLFAILI